MKLDLTAIHKLSPPGLLDEGPILFAVEVITNLITAQIIGSKIMLKLVRALGRCSKQARDNEAYNLNVRIKAWVLAAAERRAWVRSIIGEAAIRRWQWHRDNLYTPTAPTAPTAPITAKPDTAAKPISGPRLDTIPYIWKQFAMADLNWLRFRPLDVSPLGRTVGTPLAHWSQPRPSRGFKPVEFWAYELADDYEPNNEVGKTGARIKDTTAPIPKPLLKAEKESAEPALEGIDYKPP